MDWLDDLFERFRNKEKNMSLRRTMICYMLLALLATVVIIWGVNQTCDGYLYIIRQANQVESDYTYIGDGKFVLYEEDGVWRIGVSSIEPPQRDITFYEVLITIKTLCIPFCSVGAIVLVAWIFYRNRLQEPLHLLKMEMEAIKRNDLSFSCYYDSQDEIGDICKAMDGMRCAVQRNQREIWELIEEQRIINGAFAHDLRTPLTVIIGYTQMLSEYYRKGKIEEHILQDTLVAIEKQAVRMQQFAGTMKDVHHFEMLEVKKERHTVSALEQEIDSFVTGLKEKTDLEFVITVKGDDTPLFYDENVLMEILSNLLSNALRYGKKKIEIIAEHQGELLDIYVRDDGRGMTRQELYQADSLYYSDKSDEHMGLGLAICKILCKKHGGQISLSNSVAGGAIVCARLRVN